MTWKIPVFRVLMPLIDGPPLKTMCLFGLQTIRIAQFPAHLVRQMDWSDMYRTSRRQKDHIRQLLVRLADGPIQRLDSGGTAKSKGAVRRAFLRHIPSA